jgi:ribonuclease III
MERLQALIGYQFTDYQLLDEALTHASLARKAEPRRRSNQRLEFLGDAVLQLALSEKLFHLLEEADEGTLSKARARLVSTTALAALARRLQLGDFLQMDRGEELSGGRQRDSILADSFEALIGAVFLDGGVTSCRAVVERLFAPELTDLLRTPEDQNPKGQLQELLQAINHQAPTYRLLNSSGPDHQREFVVEVLWGSQALARGHGRSKKEAEIAAAEQALLQRSTWQPIGDLAVK